MIWGRNYVRDIYRLDNKLFTTISVPENWVGLREYVAASDLPHKTEILSIIDDDTSFKNLDAKEWRIKSVYKDEYAVLLHTRSDIPPFSASCRNQYH